MPKSYKVMIDHEVYNALKTEALFRNLSLKDTLAGLVLKNISPEAQKVLKLLHDKKDSKAQNTIEPQEDLETHVERKSYSKDISSDSNHQRRSQERQAHSADSKRTRI
jgi:hypothetical protein